MFKKKETDRTKVQPVQRKSRLHVGILILLLFSVVGAFAHGWYVQKELLKLHKQRKEAVSNFKIIRTILVSQDRQLETHKKRLDSLTVETFRPKGIDNMNLSIKSLETRITTIETTVRRPPGGRNCVRNPMFNTIQCGF